MTKTERLLTALAALKGKLPHEVFPWAYKKFAPRSLTPGYGCAVDLYAPDVTLDDLLRVADACYENGVQMWTVENDNGETVHRTSFHRPLQMHLGRVSGEGPTRHAAVRNALERAAGVEP